MSGMLFMLRISLEVMPLAVQSPIVFAGLALMGGWAVCAWRLRAHVGTKAVRPIWQLVSLVVMPLGMLAWGLIWWPAPHVGKSPQEGTVLHVLLALVVAHLLLALWLIWHHRERVLLASSLAIATSLWAIGAYFTATMAITNTWL